MLKAQTVRRWCFVHKWTSLAGTIFLLMLCITGLPLIFHHEIEHAFGPAEIKVAPNTPTLSLDRVMARAKEERPDLPVPRYLVWDRTDRDILYAVLNRAADAPQEDAKTVVLHARTAAVIPPSDAQDFMHFMYDLHVDMFAGLPGKLFLGFMGFLFVVAIVSGAVIYGPFMRKLDFGAVRRGRSRRVKWLDLHNLLGIVTLCWALVVGATGVLNTWSDLLLDAWRGDQLATMTAPYKNRPVPTRLVSLDDALAAGQGAAPGMTPSFIAFPGTPFTSGHHYGVFMQGDRPLTKRLFKPVLVDAESGKVTDTRDLPWYLTALLVSRPLHFGDYGGMPLKVIWTILDLLTIVTLGSGLYLWLKRGASSPIEARLKEIEREQAERPRGLAPGPAE